jgi:limonene-1,2-epoxide hydrolase
MNTTGIILISVIVILIAAALWFVYRERRSAHLKEQFGPEYNYTVRQYGDESRAQDALAARARRVERFTVRALSPEEHDRFVQRWESVQRSFVDDPAGSIQGADTLVNELLTARAYPVADFEHRAEDISVDHPHVVQNYRAAHSIYERQVIGKAGTEELRQAFVHYRALFEELLEGHLSAEGRRRV